MKSLHLLRELFDLIPPDQPETRFRIGQADRSPVGRGLSFEARDGFEVRMPRVEQLLASREKLALGTEGLGDPRLDQLLALRPA